MLLILLLLYFSRSTTNGAPLSLALRDTSKPDLSSSLPPCMCPDSRSVWDIIWSCFGTIFLCAWVSVHLNIPPPDETWWRPLLRRIELMTWTILVPEMMILWAMRQYIGARSIAKQYQDRGWNKTHGHFLQMGGFMLFDGKARKGVLSHDRYFEGFQEPTDFRINELAKNGSIIFPSITKEEIDDRSKSDALSKCIVLGQTGWFVLQCIMRKVQGLVITELELITVTLAVLNGFLYFFWWDKPFDVQMPVRVELIAENLCVPLVPTEVLSTNGKNTTPLTFRSLIMGVFRQSLKWLHNVFTSIPPLSNFGGHVLEMLTTVFFRLPKATIRGIVGRIVEIADFTLLSVQGVMQVPTFYSDYVSTSVNTVYGPAGIGILFGAIHCAGWNFIFPTHTELVIWRVCSIIIASSPAFLLFAMIFSRVYDYYEETPGHSFFLKIVVTYTCRAAILISIISSPIYVLARIALIVEAFLALRNLPDGAYAVVKWTTFIPHI